MFCANYTIKRGDTLYSISRQQNVPVDAIISANPFINVYNLQIGDMICLPISIPGNTYIDTTTYEVVEGDSLGQILEDNGADLGDFMQLNDLYSIYLEPGSTVRIPIYGEDDIIF